ncbi:hypothetical protein [Teredinibacter turnerae]|uniref:hypothetical protein n=1 Tax=Teredinibacter turnerae TaxID=2426 RepID=UPI0003A92979|nr:hypothetical protein [Teredinibacter turnerae]
MEFEGIVPGEMMQCGARYLATELRVLFIAMPDVEGKKKAARKERLFGDGR